MEVWTASVPMDKGGLGQKWKLQEAEIDPEFYRRGVVIVTGAADVAAFPPSLSLHSSTPLLG